MKFSFIVTAYNVERYIETCVRSILTQSLSDFEVIIIDDCSTDQTRKVLDRYDTDPRVQINHLNQTKGCSYGRNLGLDLAQGAWIAVIDGDDFITSDYLEIVNSAIENYPSIDMVFIPASKYYDSTKRFEPIPQVAKEHFTGNPYEIFDFSLLCTQTQVLRKEVWDHVRFPVGKYHEDVFTIWRTLEFVKSAYILNSPIYVYRQREGSITHSHFKQRYLDLLEACVEEYKGIKDKISEIAKGACLSSIYACSKYITTMYKRSSETEFAYRVCEKLESKDFDF